MTTSQTNATGTHVLLVDNDPAALKELQDILEHEDIPTAAAGSIDEAYASLGADPEISVVVTDALLTAPCGMSTHGADFAALAGRRFPERQLSFVVLHGEMEPGEQTVVTGAVNYVTKPLVPDALVSAVRQAT